MKVDALMKQEASKAAVQLKIEGATWGHFACHGDFDTISITLAERKVESSAGAASGESKKAPGVKVGRKKKNPVVVKVGRGAVRWW